MAETPKTPKCIQIKKLRPRAEGSDDYTEYMQAVLRQASEFPDKPSKMGKH